MYQNIVAVHATRDYKSDSVYKTYSRINFFKKSRYFQRTCSKFIRFLNDNCTVKKKLFLDLARFARTSFWKFYKNPYKSDSLEKFPGAYHWHLPFFYKTVVRKHVALLRSSLRCVGSSLLSRYQNHQLNKNGINCYHKHCPMKKKHPITCAHPVYTYTRVTTAIRLVVGRDSRHLSKITTSQASVYRLQKVSDQCTSLQSRSSGVSGQSRDARKVAP